ncbi:hypothetical protein BO83DRAFT_219720 [Aspergillus eucalypticola CBS 122712]|uniref:Uncharacterized protein n=1 Tax=Aspergillus eucalypticola (strain CBS 122712 / IBT 29274) TaxID=1448314 RepID=A0A317W1H4_ASPEC|nr:uncharacterized protein BO83DRAFT_219720 [Aspergillus eucalypticola CBS 122712]PWY79087.1 hypothetical protein BO83DRAFT_219720 [Aspergillus eucalypticola CBS 122712]
MNSVPPRPRPTLLSAGLWLPSTARRADPISTPSLSGGLGILGLCIVGMRTLGLCSAARSTQSPVSTAASIVCWALAAGIPQWPRGGGPCNLYKHFRPRHSTRANNYRRAMVFERDRRNAHLARNFFSLVPSRPPAQPHLVLMDYGDLDHFYP